MTKEKQEDPPVFVNKTKEEPNRSIRPLNTNKPTMPGIIKSINPLTKSIGKEIILLSKRKKTFLIFREQDSKEK